MSIETKEFKGIKMNLQTFAGNEGEGGEPEVFRYGYNPDEEIEFPQGLNPLYEGSEGEEGIEGGEGGEEPFTTNEPNQIDPNQQQVPNTFDFGGRIVDPNDPTSIQGAYEDFQNSQRYIQQLINENRQQQMLMQQFVQQQQMQPQQFQQQNQFQQAPVIEEPQLSEEEQNEKLMEKFYENPSQFFKEMKEEAIREARKDVDPFITEKKIEAEVTKMTSQYGEDFIQHIPAMQQLVVQLGDSEVERMGLERVYLMARGMQQPSYQQQPQVQQQPSIEQYLQDPQFIQQYIANNPQVQQVVMQQYNQTKQQNQPPFVMGNTSGGARPLANEQKPKSIAEASKLLKQTWNI